MSTHNDVTIIIPTRNRHYYLKRILNYYSSCSFRIIIVDSSIIYFKHNILKKNIEYNHLPNESYFKKLYNVLKIVKTKYVLLCADDDFIIPNSISQCISFLEQNPSYFSAQGTTVYFFNELFPKWHPLLLNTYGLDINKNKPSERIKQLFETYTPLHYTIHRTDNLTDTFNNVIKLSDIFVGINEYFLNIICIINGKHKILPILYSAREISFTSAIYTLPNVSKFLNDKDLRIEFEKFIDILAIYLKNKEEINIEEAKKIIWDIFKTSKYFNPKSPNDNGIYESPIKSKLIKRIVNLIPYIKIVKKLYNNHVYKQILIKEDRPIMAIDLKGYPFSDKSALNEWLGIKKMIIKHWVKIFFSNSYFKSI